MTSDAVEVSKCEGIYRLRLEHATWHIEAEYWRLRAIGASYRDDPDAGLDLYIFPDDVKDIACAAAAWGVGVHDAVFWMLDGPEGTVHSVDSFSAWVSQMPKSFRDSLVPLSRQDNDHGIGPLDCALNQTRLERMALNRDLWSIDFEEWAPAPVED